MRSCVFRRDLLAALDAEEEDHAAKIMELNLKEDAQAKLLRDMKVSP